jgi:hypothetical protein
MKNYLFLIVLLQVTSCVILKDSMRAITLLKYSEFAGAERDDTATLNNLKECYNREAQRLDCWECKAGKK